MLDHVHGEEILTEDKQAIRQLYKQARFMPSHLSVLYNVGESTINRVLRYDQTTRDRPTRTSRPHLLNNAQVNWIIKWLSETYRQRTLNWTKVHDELKLKYAVKTLEVRLKQRGYFKYVACQKPYLTPD
jgi:transposase